MSGTAPGTMTFDIPTVEGILAAEPRNGGAWSALGVLLRRAGRNAASIGAQRRGLEYEPAHAGIWSNLGNALTDCGRYDEGVAAHLRAYALAPDASSSLFNLAIGLRKAGRFAMAIQVLDHALALSPGNASLDWERALCLLQSGDYARGLEAYESRRGIPAYRNRTVPGTPWDGGPLDGRTIFLSTEQGFGDALLAARYVPSVKARGGRILLECHPEQRRIFAALPVDAFITAGAPFPDYDVQASLMSLPRLFGTTAATVPPPVPLAVPEEARARAAGLVGPADGTLKVGIVWSGRTTFADNARRATTLDRFLRFLEVPGVRLYSLQKGPPEEQLAALGTATLIAPLGPQLDDFAVTAAVIERLDLVVMTDSSVAHLAGSLGRPVWNLVQYVPYWIYGHEGGFSGDGTPWYPSMRLFRQGSDEDWERVFDRVKAELAALAARQPAALTTAA